VADWIKQLKPASFRGVPFGVKVGESRFGRRLAVHEYPKRDKPFIEDMGRKTRPMSIVGFLVTDSRVYGGGPVIGQRERFIAAAETNGAAKLVHPTYGELTVRLEEFACTERWDEGHYFEIGLKVIEDGGRVFPRPEPETEKAVAAKGVEAKLQAAEAWAAKATAALTRGSIAVQKALATARQWTDRITGLGRDATGMFRLTGALAGSFGRYFRGALQGGFKAITGFRQPLTSAADLIAAGAARRALLALRGDAVLAALGQLGQGGSLQDVADAVAAQVETLADGALDPADRVRLLLDLAGFAPSQDLVISPMGSALADLYRRAAVVALSAAGAAYQPASFDDAARLLDQIVAVLDAEILLAGDAGEDGVYAALRAQRAAVVEDLRSRGADLAPIVTVATPEPMPALALAQSLYRDAGRGDELITQADPVHPLFMPVSFQALAR
jgi:prophage DNA circulation protein